MKYDFKVPHKGRKCAKQIPDIMKIEESDRFCYYNWQTEWMGLIEVTVEQHLGYHLAVIAIF